MKEIKNTSNEKLDYIFEGNKDSKEIIILTHGFGTNKDEGYKFFKEMSEKLSKTFLILRYDLSGSGKSEGLDFEFNLIKASEDLKIMIKFCKNNFQNKSISLISHSLGSVITAILSPKNIKKIILTSVTNSNLNSTADRISKRISKNSVVNEKSISSYKRTSGLMQNIGPSFWITLRECHFLANLKKLQKNTKLTLIFPLQDEIISHKDYEDFKKLESSSILFLNGDHNFTKKKDRTEVYGKILKILSN